MQTIIVDTTPGFRMPTLFYSQGDIGRTFAIDLRSRFGDSLPASPTITIQATKPSGLGFSVASTSLSGAVATFTVTETMSNEAGRFPAELKVVKSGTTLYTANFYIECEASAHPEGTTDGDLDSIMPKFMSVQTTTLPAGDSATYSFDPDTNTATFGIPKGADGSLTSQVLAADYSSSKTYAVGDYVYYNGNLYRCSTAITTAEAWTSGHWTQVALANDVSDVKSELSVLQDFTNVEMLTYDSIVKDLKNGATWNSVDTLTVPTGSTGNSSYIGYRINSVGKINRLKGRKIVVEVNATISSDIASHVYVRGLNNGSGVTYTHIKSKPEEGCFLFTVDCSADMTATYLIFDVYTSNAYTYASDQTIKLDSCNIIYGDIDEYVDDKIAPLVEYATKKTTANLTLENVGSASNGASLSSGNLILSIPSGSTGKNSYLGQRVRASIGTLLGRKVKQTIHFTSSDISLGLTARLISNKTGVTEIASDIDIVNGVAHIYYEVASDATAEYVITALNVSSNVAVSSNTTVEITSYTSEFYYEDVIDVINHYLPTHGEMMSCMGHSMTSMDRWQKTTQSDLNLDSYENTAIYGGILTQHYTDVENIDTASDIVTIWYDTNDWSNSITLGQITDNLPDTVSFYSALKYVCEWIGTNIPTAKVVLISSPKRFDSVFVDVDDLGYQLNNNGNTLEDFANAIRDVADLYSYKYCDLFHRSGINKNNYASYLDSDKLHPSNYGAGVIGHLIAKTVLS